MGGIERPSGFASVERVLVSLNDNAELLPTLMCMPWNKLKEKKADKLIGKVTSDPFIFYCWFPISFLSCLMSLTSSSFNVCFLFFFSTTSMFLCVVSFWASVGKKRRKKKTNEEVFRRINGNKSSVEAEDLFWSLIVVAPLYNGMSSDTLCVFASPLKCEALCSVGIRTVSGKVRLEAV